MNETVVPLVEQTLVVVDVTEVAPSLGVFTVAVKLPP
jgi:hypothetical protein